MMLDGVYVCGKMRRGVSDLSGFRESKVEDRLIADETEGLKERALALLPMLPMLRHDVFRASGAKPSGSQLIGVTDREGTGSHFITLFTLGGSGGRSR